MDTTKLHSSVTTRKRVRSDRSTSDDERLDYSDDETTSEKKTNENWPRFIVLEAPHPTAPLSKLSPFLVSKAIQGKFGTVKNVKKMKSGALLIEASREAQAKQILATTNLAGLEVSATSHRTLNTSKGVIKDYHKDLYYMKDSDIQQELSDQGVVDVSRFMLKKNNEQIKTNTLFITFNTPTPPKELKLGYYIVRVQPYIPNPLRCFNCQKFGHSKKFCKNNIVCWKCGDEGHDGEVCTSDTICCVNCKGDHCSSSKACPVWIQEKEIQRVKTDKAIPYSDARRLVTSSSSANTVTSYASVVKSAIKKVSVEVQTQMTWMYEESPFLLVSSPKNTRSTSTSTEQKSQNTVKPVVKDTKKSEQSPDNKSTKSTKNKQKEKNIDSEVALATGNRYQSLDTDLEVDMDVTPVSRSRRSSPRSRSRSRGRNNISPVKYK